MSCNTQTHQDILHEEKERIIAYIKTQKSTAPSYEIARKKNIADSVEYRKKGNEVYSSKFHNDEIHEQAWRLYSQSIALAPNDTEELALGYGNRSALLFHFKKYEHCIQDCDRAIKITRCKLLQSKLLCRKAESLVLLKRSSATSVCQDALQHFSELQLDENVKSKFTDKLRRMKSAARTQKSQLLSSTEKNDLYDFSDFASQTEVPCASDAVAIRYNEKWGRHIVATKDIQPGDIIAIERKAYLFVEPDGMYLFCSYCTQQAWDSIPCEHCTYDVYCSESCKSKAWTKYHQFECSVYSNLWNWDSIIGEKDRISVCQCAMRFVFSAHHDADGINGLKQELLDIQKCSGKSE